MIVNTVLVAIKSLDLGAVADALTKRLPKNTRIELFHLAAPQSSGYTVQDVSPDSDYPRFPQ